MARRIAVGLAPLVLVSAVAGGPPDDSRGYFAPTFASARASAYVLVRHINASAVGLGYDTRRR